MIPPDRERLEELAEEIWSLTEAGENSHARVANGSKIQDPGSVLASMESAGLAVRRGDRVELTAAGAEIASTIVRRHRLAEMLFTQVMALKEEVAESTACEMEHILSPEVTESVCTFLGHPPHCPHGKPIPKGRCCELFRRAVSPLVAPLLDMRLGESARIVFITPRAIGSLDRIATLGVIPGASVRLKQKSPAVVLEVGQTTIALDRGIARDVYVRRPSEEGSPH
jgi:DtxR family transcriptional regulator, Mn-dependent transcriptional regulator